MTTDVTITLYKFAELPEEVQQTVLYNYSCHYEYSWGDDCIASIKEFCDYFAAKLSNWRIGPWENYDYDCKYDNFNFRGIKLTDFDKDKLPASLWIDCDIWSAFYDTFEQTGDAKAAFEAGLDAGFESWRADWEFCLSDDELKEEIVQNDMLYYEDGRYYGRKEDD